MREVARGGQGEKAGDVRKRGARTGARQRKGNGCRAGRMNCGPRSPGPGEWATMSGMDTERDTQRPAGAASSGSPSGAPEPHVPEPHAPEPHVSARQVLARFAGSYRPYTFLFVLDLGVRHGARGRRPGVPAVPQLLHEGLLLEPSRGHPGLARLDRASVRGAVRGAHGLPVLHHQLGPHHGGAHGGRHAPRPVRPVPAPEASATTTATTPAR